MDNPAHRTATKLDEALRVTDLSKQFSTSDQRPVLSNLDLSVKAGSFMTIVGPSGCGKSTLLYMIAGLVLPTKGAIRVFGENFQESDAEKVSMVFQEPNLLPWKTALQNVAFPLELRRVALKEREEKAMELLKLVGLEDFARHFPHELSGGMKQRVSIARGLILEPKLLLMDEPFGALDEQTRMRMGQELLKIWERTGKTIIFVTHSINEAVYLSDSVLVLNGKPSSIVDAVDVDLPRPRDIAHMGTPTFGQLRDRLWRAIE